MRKKPSSLHWVAGHATPASVHITRVFNFGTWKEWKKLGKDYSAKSIEQAVRKPLKGQWTPRGKAFAEVLFRVTLPQDSLISYDAA